MTETTLIGLFVAVNLAQFAFAGTITAVSYWAYRSTGRRSSLRYATIGFLCITIGGLLAPIYELGIKSDPEITMQELLTVQIVEVTVIGVGLALLLYSIYGYDTGTQRRHTVDVRADLGGRRDGD